MFRATLFLSVLLSLSHAFAAKSVLVIMSSEDHVDLYKGGEFETGYFLREVWLPVTALKGNGYSIVVGTPTGSPPVLDPASTNLQWWPSETAVKQAVSFAQDSNELHQPVKLSDLTDNYLARFDAVYVPGGHAPMQDLYRDKEVGRILRYFHDHNKLTALACHGPSALLATLDDPEKFVQKLKIAVWLRLNRHPLEPEPITMNELHKMARDWPYAGYNMTVFSKAEDRLKETKGDFGGGSLTFYPERALETAGGRVSEGYLGDVTVVRDRELLTSQNPESDVLFTHQLIDALVEDSFPTSQPAL